MVGDLILGFDADGFLASVQSGLRKAVDFHPCPGGYCPAEMVWDVLINDHKADGKEGKGYGD